MAREVRILLKRSDISAGTLQVIDLLPNQSQLNNPYEPVGQSKYIRPPDTADADSAVTGTTTTFASESKGLAAYLQVNVDDGTGVAALATATAASVLALDTVTVGGFVYIAFSGARTSGANNFDMSGTDTATALSLANAVNDPENGVGLSSSVNVTASPAVAVVTFTADSEGTDGNAITLVSSDGTRLAVTGGGTLASGADATLLTPAEANASKDDILDNLVAFGDLTAAAVTMDLTAVNGEMAAGTLTAAQHLDVLDILAGKEYIAPLGTVVETAGAVAITGGPGFVDGSLRVIYDTDAFMVSQSGGYLSTLLRTDYSFAEATGTNLEAVAVINNDGTLY